MERRARELKDVSSTSHPSLESVYEREVQTIRTEKDNKRLLEIYRREEEREGVNRRVTEKTLSTVSYILSSASLLPLYPELPTLMERIEFFFDEYYRDNDPSYSPLKARDIMNTLRRFLLVLLKVGEIGDETYGFIDRYLAITLKCYAEEDKSI